MKNQKTEGMIKKWEKIARRKFRDAAVEKDPMGKRLIEHGAACYFNCATQLREALVSRASSNNLNLCPNGGPKGPTPAEDVP